MEFEIAKLPRHFALKVGDEFDPDNPVELAPFDDIGYAAKWAARNALRR
jgi:hypothetical protein